MVHTENLWLDYTNIIIAFESCVHRSSFETVKNLRNKNTWIIPTEMITQDCPIDHHWTRCLRYSAANRLFASLSL